jgi:hypothetical protein
MLYWPLFLYLYTLISGRAWHEFESKIAPLSFLFSLYNQDISLHDW